MVSIRIKLYRVELIKQLELRNYFYIKTIFKFVVPLKDNDRFRKYSLFPIRPAINSDLPKIIQIA